jgi:hypothetical protein
LESCHSGRVIRFDQQSGGLQRIPFIRQSLQFRRVDYEVLEFDSKSTDDFIESLSETIAGDHFKARIVEKK